MRKKPFADEAGQAVYQGINELEAQIGIAKGIPVGEDQGNRQQTLPFLPLRPFFAGKQITGCRLALAHGVRIKPAEEGGSLRQWLQAGILCPPAFYWHYQIMAS
jgi:hypothetical protein